MFSEIVRDRSLELIGRAYTSITVSDFSRYVGLPEAEAASLAAEQPGWEVTDRAPSVNKNSGIQSASSFGDDAKIGEKMICPMRRKPLEYKTVLAEKQLAQLTDFVAFLEK